MAYLLKGYTARPLSTADLPDGGVTAGKLGASVVDDTKLASAVLARMERQDVNDIVNVLRDQLARLDAPLTHMRGATDRFVGSTGLVTTTGAAQDATNKWVTNAGAPTLIDRTLGTNIGSMTAQGGLAAGFDGTTSQTVTQGAAAASNGTTSYIGKDDGSALYVVKQAIVYASSDAGFQNSTGTLVTVTLQGSTDNFSASIVDIASNTGTDTNGTSITVSAPNNTVAYRYRRLKIVAQSAATNNKVAEAQFYAAGAATDATLVSATYTALAVPTEGRIVLCHQGVVACTVNTDYKAWVSRDGGSTWTQVTLAQVGSLDANTAILTGTCDLSGQPSGTSMKWKVTTHNTKEQRLHGIGLTWR